MEGKEEREEKKEERRKRGEESKKIQIMFFKKKQKSKVRRRRRRRRKNKRKNLDLHLAIPEFGFQRLESLHLILLLLLLFFFFFLFQRLASLHQARPSGTAPAWHHPRRQCALWLRRTFYNTASEWPDACDCHQLSVMYEYPCLPGSLCVL